ncbi:Tyrosine-protein phosphatase precursor [Oceanobacillus oncorhynchi]|uniref:Tyrosine-protein phosphatase n=1 Tax=Oceanobacillus oncorhynchi TaxID=545501 RepID=A0A0A1MD55_9BACI|nr:tyrosine-protein phosphatase [Oceanobacillus oncorhynchi]CEI81018.1 Tyrosine-protein phosphatase precursor [Oceanobacillus oncorhynchi]
MTTETLLFNPARHIALEGTQNIRDLGGYPTKDGKQTKWGKYYRADSLHQVSPEGHAFLQKERGIHTVIDLRMSMEGKYRKEDKARYDFYNIPLLDPATFTTKMPKSLVEMYILMLETSKPKFKQIMDIFLENKGNPVLFHCRVGKDRTGVLAAILLDLAGVPRDIIVKDYALTGEYKKITDEELHHRPPLMSRNQFKAMLSCEPAYMEAFLDYLYKEYGSAADFLKVIGLREEEITDLRDDFIEEG